MNARPALAAVALAVLPAACALDLHGLTGGGASGTTGAGGAHTTSSSTSSSGGTAGGGASSGGAGGAVPSVLDCAPCPDDGGACAPVALATGTDADGPAGIALDGNTLYWVNTSGGAVMRVDGSGTVTKLASANQPIAVAASGGFVVWAEQDGVHGCHASSCASGAFQIAGGTEMGSVQGVAYDGQLVFYTDRVTGGMGGKATRCPPQPGCPGPQDIGTTLWLPAGLRIHGDQVFWAEAGDGNPNGSVARAPKSATGEVKIAAGLPLPTSVVADDLYVYWTESTLTGGKVRRCPSATYCNTVTDLATDLAAPLDIALAGGHVYWTNAGDGTLLRCPASGCGGNPPAVLASGRDGLRRLAVGSTCVFFTDDTGGGSVSKVRR